MTKNFDSGMKTFFFPFNKAYASARVFGSPTRLTETFELYMENLKHNSQDCIDILDDDKFNDKGTLDRVLRFAEVAVKSQFNRNPDKYNLARVNTLARLGEMGAPNGWMHVEKKLMDSGCNILDAFLAAKSWLENRQDGLEYKRNEAQESLAREQKIRELARTRSALDRSITALESERISKQARLERLQLEAEQLHERIVETKERVNQIQIELKSQRDRRDCMPQADTE